MVSPMPVLKPEVAKAIADGTPVVALESTIISHGLPYPENLAAANRFEEILRESGVTPATIAVVDGQQKVGLEPQELNSLAQNPSFKASVRDLPMLAVKRQSAGTTVAATAHIAAKAGIKVFATGGLGGVHKGANTTFDESADIPTLANTPIVVVSAGVKSILDIRATLERMETLGVALVGFRTDTFPSFWLPTSEFSLDFRVESAREVADIFEMQRAQNLDSALLVANPVPLESAWNKADHDEVVEKALAAAAKIEGKAVTPFLLDFIVKASAGKSLEVNLALVENNIRVAAQIATELAGQSSR